jgi:uncharacterized membrane protein
MQNGMTGDRDDENMSIASFPEFSATLLPHRSLSRKGFIGLMLAISVVSFVSGAVFVAMGAWPVSGFFGLDVLLLYCAFRLNYRTGRIREQIDMSGPELRITRRHPSGKAESWTFNPYWVRFEHVRRENGADELSLSSHGRKLIFGAFLSDIEKESFADALSSALAKQKSIPTRT